MAAYVRIPKESRKLLKAGFMLLRKPDKTAEEEVAASSYKKMLIYGIITSIIIVLVMLSGDNDFFLNLGKTRRTGGVRDGQVWYVDNIVHYISFDELGLDRELPDETKLQLFFDENNNIIGVETQAQEYFKAIKMILKMFTKMIILIVIIVITIILPRNTFGKPYWLWYSKYKGNIPYR